MQQGCFNSPEYALYNLFRKKVKELYCFLGIITCFFIFDIDLLIIIIMTMKHNIAVVDPSGKISGILFSIAAELDAAVHGFGSADEFSRAVDHKMQVADDPAMVIICIVHSSADHPGFKAAVSLAGQLKENSALSSIPVFVIGPDRAEFTTGFTGACSRYIPLPLKKSELKELLIASLVNVQEQPEYTSDEPVTIAESFALADSEPGHEHFESAKTDDPGYVVLPAADKPAAADKRGGKAAAPRAKKKKAAAAAPRKKPATGKKKGLNWLSRLTMPEKRQAAKIFADVSGLNAGEVVQQSIKAQLYIISGDLDKADKIINSPGGLSDRNASLPFDSRFYFRTMAMHNLALAENESVERVKRDFVEKALSACKESVKAAAGLRPYYADSLTLCATCYWAAGKYRKALKFWGRAVAEAERLGTLSYLARAYFAAAGHFLVSEKVPEKDFIKFIKLAPAECIDRAESIFREMDLVHDLEQLEALRRCLN